jgi:hypothetical protein
MDGRVINLLSNDFSKFDIALAFLHDLWKGPFETILLGFLIYREVGISGVFGILFILSFIPIQCEYEKVFEHCIICGPCDNKFVDLHQHQKALMTHKSHYNLISQTFVIFTM